MVAARCIPFGIGTDIYGSLRAPGHFSGVRTLKPTAGRGSQLGVMCSSYEEEFTCPYEPVQVASGPVARSVQDCITACRILFHP